MARELKESECLDYMLKGARSDIEDLSAKVVLQRNKKTALQQQLHAVTQAKQTLDAQIQQLPQQTNQLIQAQAAELDVAKNSVMEEARRGFQIKQDGMLAGFANREAAALAKIKTAEAVIQNIKKIELKEKIAALKQASRHALSAPAVSVGFEYASQSSAVGAVADVGAQQAQVNYGS